MKGLYWVKFHDLALKMNKKWLFSLETEKYNRYSNLDVIYKCIQWGVWPKSY